MRRALICVAALVLGSPLAALAQVRSFPYEAVVETDDVPVHCGPGFYATSRLERGDRVVVHRHDPGGWSMISPPAGEFSLVSAVAVRIDRSGMAEVVVDETSVRVGSRLSGEYGVEQVPLARGTRVTIVPGATAPTGWLVIEPPRGEYRWVLGRYLVPVQPAVRSAQDADPFAVPSNARRPETFPAPAADVKPATQTDRDQVKNDQGPTLTLGPLERESSEPALADASETLRMLDHELEGLHLFEPTEWPLDELASEYGRLKSATPSMGRQIDVRLAHIDKLRLVKEHYTSYVHLTSATDNRDAALVARHQRISSGIVQAAEPQPVAQQPTLAPPLRLAAKPAASASPLPPPAPPAEPAGEEIPHEVSRGGPVPAPGSVAVTPPALSPEPRSQITGPMLVPADSNSRPSVPHPAQLPAMPQNPGPQPGSTADSTGGPRRFDAVGVVQAAVDPPPEAPRYVLVAPDGRILVYLREQPGIPLDSFVGQAMGVDGERHRHPEMTTPMIVVEKLTPVRF